MATVSWGTPAPLGMHPAISGVASITNNSRQLGATINPSGYLYSAWQFFSQYSLAPTGSIELYAVPSLDNGTTFNTGDANVDPSFNNLIGVFTLWGNANSGMTSSVLNVVNSPLLFKPMLINRSGSTIPANSGALSVVFYNQIVS